MKTLIRKSALLSLFFWVVAGPVLAQSPQDPQISLSATRFINSTLSRAKAFQQFKLVDGRAIVTLSKIPPNILQMDMIEVEFTDPVGPRTLEPGNVKIELPAGVQIRSGGNIVDPQTIVPRSVNFSAGSAEEVTIEYSPGLVVEKTGTTPAGKMRVCFQQVFFVGDASSPRQNICTDADILNLLTRAELDAKIQAQLDFLNQVPKTSSEKNIFASGFVAKGEGEASEGGADINLNSNDLGIRGLFASLRLKKATATDADPKNFESSITYRNVYPTDTATLKRIRALTTIIDDPNSTPQQRAQASAERQELIDRREPLAGAYIVDLGTKLEGEALNFRVTNFLFDGSAQFQSATFTLFGSRKGFWKFRFIPVGVEAGPNLNKDEGATDMMTPQQTMEKEDVDYAVRYKAGAMLTLFYKDDPEGRFIFRRVEADTQFVYRYLFRREVMFNEETMMNVETTKGNKPWFQADAKFFLSDTDSGRFGFKISYNRGSLPPVFAKTNSFQFGLIYETADDAQKAK